MVKVCWLANVRVFVLFEKRQPLNIFSRYAIGRSDAYGEYDHPQFDSRPLAIVFYESLRSQLCDPVFLISH